MPLDEWQESALEAAMGERSDGRWASKFVGMSAPRQNGKSQLIVARALAGLLLFGEKTIIISAHETDTAREVWRRLIDVVEDNPKLERRVTGRMNAVNRESLTFGEGLNKQIVKLKARSQTGSRGFSSDCLLLDEAQILGKRAWGSIVPTMSARPNPQMWLFGTPPVEGDEPFAFTRVRESAVNGKARHCWLEWAAEPDDDFDDPATWAKANPSFGVRISEEACADDRAAMDDQQFAVERLGMWLDGEVGGALPIRRWLAAADPDADRGRQVVFGLDLAGERDVWLAVAWDRGDDSFVMLANDGKPIPAYKAVAECKRLKETWGGPVATSALGDELEREGIEVVPVSVADFAVGCGIVADRLDEGRIRHGNQGALNDSVRAVKWRNAPLQSGERAFQLKDAPEAGPAAAVARALFGLENYAPMPQFY